MAGLGLAIGELHLLSIAVIGGDVEDISLLLAALVDLCNSLVASLDSNESRVILEKVLAFTILVPAQRERSWFRLTTPVCPTYYNVSQPIIKFLRIQEGYLSCQGQPSSDQPVLSALKDIGIIECMNNTYTHNEGELLLCESLVDLVCDTVLRHLGSKVVGGHGLV